MKRTSRPPSGPFALKVHDVPIEQLRPTETIETGIRAGQQIPGNVPWYEEDDARIEAGYNFAQWLDLPYSLRVREVAHYRLRKLVALHRGDAEVRHARMMTKKGKHGV